MIKLGANNHGTGGWFLKMVPLALGRDPALGQEVERRVWTGPMERKRRIKKVGDNSGRLAR